MRKILFVRKFKKPSGGQIKVRDYFEHCLQHPAIAPYVYFTPDSRHAQSHLWRELPKERIVRELALEAYDALFLAGKDWELLPAGASGVKIINLVQHVKHAEARDGRFTFLSRPAYRICVSEEVFAAITPHANGPAHVIPNGVSLGTFAPNAEKARNSILIWARKNPALGRRLHATLLERGFGSALLVDYLPREHFAEALGKTDIFVALTNPSEGFYLPGLEGLASGCAVVCADAVGNRGFCVHEKTCLMPKWGDYDEHVVMIERLLRDEDLKETLRRAGQMRAQTFSLQNERARFYQFLDEHILR
jgi:glycosyltransferase involved in cell wall biosynthesis